MKNESIIYFIKKFAVKIYFPHFIQFISLTTSIHPVKHDLQKSEREKHIMKAKNNLSNI